MLISETFRDLSENFLQETAMKTQEFSAFCEDQALEFSEVLEDL